MLKLLWIGSPFFAGDMKKCGWDLRFHNFENTAVFHWQDLLEIADGPRMCLWWPINAVPLLFWEWKISHA